MLSNDGALFHYNNRLASILMDGNQARYTLLLLCTSYYERVHKWHLCLIKHRQPEPKQNAATQNRARLLDSIVLK